jgi:hypothetical protein
LWNQKSANSRPHCEYRHITQPLTSAPETAHRVRHDEQSSFQIRDILASQQMAPAKADEPMTLINASKDATKNHTPWHICGKTKRGSQFNLFTLTQEKRLPQMRIIGRNVMRKQMGLRWSFCGAPHEPTREHRAFFKATVRLLDSRGAVCCHRLGAAF